MERMHLYVSMGVAAKKAKVSHSRRASEN